MAEIIVDLNKIETDDELLVRLYPAKGEKGEQGLQGAKGDKGETGSSGGSAVVVDAVADMIDTTQAYLYVGNESGYTKGDWYYYDGTAWVSGGKYGADGGVNTNARNILKYILERVAYTEQGMKTYVDALYQALAQGGDTPSVTTYMIINALTNVTNSNTATGIDEGESYTATLTADTDYTIDSVVITMGGTDITSTAYSNGEINIASVTGDVVITAIATEGKYSYKLSDGDLIILKGALWVDSAHQGEISFSSRNDRRGVAITSGVKPIYNTENQYFPIPVPKDATSVTYSITPNTATIGGAFYTYDETNNLYTRTWDVGGKTGSYTGSFAAGTYDYFTLNCAISADPTEVIINFNK